MNEDPRVLVIDDDEALRELVIRIVKPAGYQDDAEGDGQAGRDRLAERAYAVTLSDVRMPGMLSRRCEVCPQPLSLTQTSPRTWVVHLASADGGARGRAARH